MRGGPARNAAKLLRIISQSESEPPLVERRLPTTKYTEGRKKGVAVATQSANDTFPRTVCPPRSSISSDGAGRFYLRMTKVSLDLLERDETGIKYSMNRLIWKKLSIRSSYLEINCFLFFFWDRNNIEIRFIRWWNFALRLRQFRSMVWMYSFFLGRFEEENTRQANMLRYLVARNFSCTTIYECTLLLFYRIFFRFLNFNLQHATQRLFNVERRNYFETE